MVAASSFLHTTIWGTSFSTDERITERSLHYWDFTSGDSISTPDSMYQVFKQPQLVEATELRFLGRATGSNSLESGVALLKEYGEAANWIYQSHIFFPALDYRRYEFMIHFLPTPPILVPERRCALQRFNLVE
jgi:hypothetical protein